VELRDVAARGAAGVIQTTFTHARTDGQTDWRTDTPPRTGPAVSAAAAAAAEAITWSLWAGCPAAYYWFTVLSVSPGARCPAHGDAISVFSALSAAIPSSFHSRRST